MINFIEFHITYNEDDIIIKDTENDVVFVVDSDAGTRPKIYKGQNGYMFQWYFDHYYFNLHGELITKYYKYYKEMELCGNYMIVIPDNNDKHTIMVHDLDYGLDVIFEWGNTQKIYNILYFNNEIYALCPCQCEGVTLKIVKLTIDLPSRSFVIDYDPDNISDKLYINSGLLYVKYDELHQINEYGRINEDDGVKYADDTCCVYQEHISGDLMMLEDGIVVKLNESGPEKEYKRAYHVEYKYDLGGLSFSD